MRETARSATIDGMGETYSHGHHESVLRSHMWRTAENSAGYLLAHLRPGMDLLDVGCGPGTITVDIASLVAPGRVVGIDASADVIAQASAGAADAGSSVSFAVGDVYAIDAAAATYDVVHAHQVLQHLADPVRALMEMRRVLKPDGIVGVRDSDYAAFAWAPRLPQLDRWMAIYHGITARNRAEADAGRHLYGWARAAGFADVVASSSNWTFTTPEDRAWWGGLWADRVVSSNYGEQALAYGLTDQSELDAIADAWREWQSDADGCFIVVHGEVIARG